MASHKRVLADMLASPDERRGHVYDETLKGLAPRLRQLASNTNSKVSVCSAALAGGIVSYKILQERMGRSSKTLRKKHPQLLDAISLFLFTPRSESQLLELQTSLTKCGDTCDMENFDVFLLHNDVDSPLQPKRGRTGGLSVTCEPNFLAFVSTAFRILTQLIDGLEMHSGILEKVYQASVSSPNTIRATGKNKSRKAAYRSTSTSSPSGYEELAMFLVSHIDETIEMCCRWFHFTRSFEVIYFIFSCAKLFPDRVRPAILKRPEICAGIIENLDASMDDLVASAVRGDQMNKHAERDVVMSHIGLVSRLQVALKLETLKDSKVLLGNSALPLYLAFARLINLHEPSNVFAGLEGPSRLALGSMAARFKGDEDSTKTLYGMTLAAWLVMADQVEEAPSDVDLAPVEGPGGHTISLNPQVLHWFRGEYQDGRPISSPPNSSTSESHCSSSESIQSDAAPTTPEGVMADFLERLRSAEPSQRSRSDTEHLVLYELPMIKQAFKLLYRFVTSPECASPLCTHRPGDMDRVFSHCGGCGVMRYCSRECQRIAWKYHGDAEMFLHKAVCKTAKNLRSIWADLLPFEKHASATSFALYQRLFNGWDHEHKDIGDVKETLLMVCLDARSDEIRGTFEGFDYPSDEGMVQIDGRTALEMLSHNLLTDAAFARFLIDNDFPTIAEMDYSDDSRETKKIEQFFVRCFMMVQTKSKEGKAPQVPNV